MRKENTVHTPFVLPRHLIVLFSVAVMSLLVACGGSSELDEHESSETSASGITLTLSAVRSSDGVGTRQITSDEPIMLQMALLDAGEDPLPGELITLTSSLVTFTPASGTVLTGSNGRASVTLLAGDVLGAGVVTAQVRVNGETITVDLNLEVISSINEGQESSTLQVSMALTSAAGDDMIRADAQGLLTVTVTDQLGVAQSNELIVLTITEALAELGTSNATLLTNVSGQATTSVSAVGAFGAGTITGSVTQGEQTFSRSLNFVVTPPAIEFGAVIEGQFREGELSITVDPLAAGGTTSVEVDVVDEDGNAFNTPLSVLFDSTCVSTELATLDEVVTTVSGHASATYRAEGCEGDDLISATTEFGGATFVAEAELTVLQDIAGAIEFVNAQPAQITLLGTGAQGLAETAEVSFRVRGEQGLPIANQEVSFALTTAVGGIELSPASAISDSDGVVSTVVQSGSISTSVGVVATLMGTEIATQSDLLAITTGIPDQDSMTIAPEVCAPEALSYFDEEVTVNVGVADAFNNPVPDGTAVAFTTEGGVIEGVCTTSGGICSVTWSSQQPRPSDGLVTIMATAIGHESFSDENGNGIFDDGDTFTDLSEAFRDDDQDLERDPSEPYIDFNEDGQHNNGDGLYNGVLCQHSTLCGDESSVSVRADREIALAGSHAVIEFRQEAVSIEEVNVPGQSLGTFTLEIGDVNGNSMPTNTEVTLSTENGELLGSESFIIGCRTDAVDISVTLQGDETPSSGAFTITVETPKGVITTSSIIVND